jgi:hypothetical protein
MSPSQFLSAASFVCSLMLSACDGTSSDYFSFHHSNFRRRPIIPCHLINPNYLVTIPILERHLVRLQPDAK